MDNPSDIIERKVIEVVGQEKKVAERIASLKEAQDKINTEWSQVEKLMIDNNVKSVKGDWGSLSIVEKPQWEYDPTILAPKFFKKVVDTKKLTDTYKLTGNQPNGATRKIIKYLMKRLK